MAKIHDFENSVRVQVVDPHLYVVYDTEIDRYEVHDRAAPGGPGHSLVMRVMNEDGTYRPVDQRTIDILYRTRYQMVNEGPEAMKRALTEQERKRRQEQSAKWADWAYGLVSDLKWAGKDIVPSTAWRDRTDPDARRKRREEIAQLGRN